MEKSLVLQLDFKLAKFHGMMMNTFTELVHLGGGVKMLEYAWVEDMAQVWILPQFWVSIIVIQVGIIMVQCYNWSVNFVCLKK